MIIDCFSKFVEVYNIRNFTSFIWFINWGAWTFKFDEKLIGNKHKYIVQRDMLRFNSIDLVMLHVTSRTNNIVYF